MILETLGNSGFRWLTSRVKKASLSPSALGDKLFIGHFIFRLCLVSFPLECNTTCSSCLSSLGVQKCSSSRAEWNLFSSKLPSFQCSVLVQVQGWCPSALTLAASPQLSLGTVQALALGETWNLLVLVLCANRGGKWRFYPVLVIIPRWKWKLREKSH